MNPTPQKGPDPVDSSHDVSALKAVMIVLVVLVGICLGTFVVMKMDKPGQSQRPVAQPSPISQTNRMTK